MRARVLWVLVTLMLGAGGLVATEVVQERLSDRQMRQRLGYSLAQIRNARAAVDAAEAHVRGTWEAMHERIVADSLADLEAVPEPPPPDTTVEEPPPVMVDLSPVLAEEAGGVRATWRAVPGVTEYAIRGESGGQVVTHTVADTTVWSPGVPEAATFCVSALGVEECVEWVRGPSPDPDPTPDPTPGEGDFPNAPAGMVVRADSDWGSIPSAWWHTNRSGVVRTTSAGGASALEFFYPRGMRNGDDPGAVGVSLNHREVYFGTRMLYDPHFIQHTLGTKLHLLMLNTGGWAWINDNAYHRGYAQGNVPPGFGIGLKAGGSPTSASPSFVAGDNLQHNAGSQPPVRLGEWITLEMHIRINDPGRANGMARMWVNGVLVTDYQNLQWGSEVTHFQMFSHAGTWGGGGGDVPVDQSWYVDRTVVMVP